MLIGPIDSNTWNTLRRLRSSLAILNKEDPKKQKRIDKELSTFEYLLSNITRTEVTENILSLTQAA
jgi:hypothetical protein